MCAIDVNTSCLMEMLLKSVKHFSIVKYSHAVVQVQLLQVPRIKSMLQHLCVYSMIVGSQLTPPTYCIS
jgi:hypothetical protein